MKIRVKFFASKPDNRLEEQINKFLESCGKIKIIDIKFATCESTCEALLIYELD